MLGVAGSEKKFTHQTESHPEKREGLAGGSNLRITSEAHQKSQGLLGGSEGLGW